MISYYVNLGGLLTMLRESVEVGVVGFLFNSYHYDESLVCSPLVVYR